MPLTQLQTEFLKKYVSSYWPLSIPKEKRAQNFSQVRAKLLEELQRLPESLRHQFMLDIANADKIGEELKFNRASKEMDIIMSRIRKVKFDLAVESSDGESPKKNYDIKQLRSNLEKVVDDYGKPGFWDELIENKSTGAELLKLFKQASQLLDKNNPTTEELKKIHSLTTKIDIKRNFLEKRTADIEKLKHRLERDASLLNGIGDQFTSETEQALKYSEIPTDEWTEKMQQDAFALRLKMTLALAQQDGVQHKDFKLTEANRNKKSREIVYAVRRKYSTVEGNDEEGNALIDTSAPNFKLVVKPITREIAVPGYVKGSGGNREALGYLISNKLSEQLGTDFGLPETHLLEVDGKSIGLPKSGNVLASVQTYLQDTYDLVKRAKEKAPESNSPVATFLDEHVDPRDIQNLAVFDLISLNTDRHAGNAMVTQDNKLVPIDHGAILPSRKALEIRFKENFLLGLPVNSKVAEGPLPEDLIVAIENIDIHALRESLMEGISDKVDTSVQEDISSGIDMSCRSAEFMKFAARHLTLKELYLAIAIAQEYIFDSPDDKKIEGFREAIKITLSRNEDKDYFKDSTGETDLMFGMKESAWNEKFHPELERLGWVTTTSPPESRQLLCSLPAIRKIVTDKIKAPNLKTPANLPKLPPSLAGNEKLWKRFWALGGLDAVKKRGLFAGGTRFQTDHNAAFAGNNAKAALVALTQLTSRLEASFIATLGRF